MSFKKEVDRWLHEGSAPQQAPQRWARGASQEEDLVAIEMMGKGVSQKVEPAPYPEPPPPTGQYASTVSTWPLEVSMVAM